MVRLKEYNKTGHISASNPPKTYTYLVTKRDPSGSEASLPGMTYKTRARCGKSFARAAITFVACESPFFCQLTLSERFKDNWLFFFLSLQVLRDDFIITTAHLIPCVAVQSGCNIFASGLRGSCLTGLDWQTHGREESGMGFFRPMMTTRYDHMTTRILS